MEIKFHVKENWNWRVEKRLHKKKHPSVKLVCFIYPGIVTIQKCLDGYITVKNDNYFQIMFAGKVLHIEGSKKKNALHKFSREVWK